MKLLFIHGAGGSPESYYYQTRHFEGSEAVALPGHPEGTPCKTIPAYAEWLRGYIWGKGYEDVVLCGHSMGGGITLQYAVNYPQELKAIITIGSGARLRVHPDYLAEDQEGIRDPDPWNRVAFEEQSDYAPELRKLIAKRRVEVGPAVAYNDMTACDQFDIMDRVGEIKLPTLAICGTEDEMTPPLYSAFLEKRLDNCRTVIIEGATHSVMLERPDLVNPAIEEFVSGLE